MSVIKTLIRFYIIQVFWLFYGPIHIAVFSSTFHLFYFFERETERNRDTPIFLINWFIPHVLPTAASGPDKSETKNSTRSTHGWQ